MQCQWPGGRTSHTSLAGPRPPSHGNPPQVFNTYTTRGIPTCSTVLSSLGPRIPQQQAGSSSRPFHTKSCKCHNKILNNSIKYFCMEPVWPAVAALQLANSFYCEFQPEYLKCLLQIDWSHFNIGRWVSPRRPDSCTPPRQPRINFQKVRNN